MKRSVSDSQNYGDDVPAQDLISPPAFSDMALEPTAFMATKGPSEIRSLFSKININLEDEVFEALWNDSRPQGGMTSLNAFRGALNEYLDQVEMGGEAKWRAERGVPAGTLRTQ